MSKKSWLNISTDSERSQCDMLTEVSKETRTLSDVLHHSRRIGGNYGSLAQSKVQQTFYIPHKVNADDTLQRLALKYGTNLQEIKRVNKLWSDAELCLSQYVYVPVNSMQLSTLRTEYPTLDVIQNLPARSDNDHKSSIDSSTTDRVAALNQSLDKLNTNSTVEDYLFKIDQQIKQTKKTLQTLNNPEDHQPKSKFNESPRLQTIQRDLTSSDRYSQTHLCNNGHYASAYSPSDDGTAVNATKQNSREKYKSLALERIQREQESFDDL